MLRKQSFLACQNCTAILSILCYIHAEILRALARRYLPVLFMFLYSMKLVELVFLVRFLLSRQYHKYPQQQNQQHEAEQDLPELPRDECAVLKHCKVNKDEEKREIACPLQPLPFRVAHLCYCLACRGDSHHREYYERDYAACHGIEIFSSCYCVKSNHKHRADVYDCEGISPQSERFPVAQHWYECRR